jgi:hypothetical protein
LLTTLAADGFVYHLLLTVRQLDYMADKDPPVVAAVGAVVLVGVVMALVVR